MNKEMNEHEGQELDQYFKDGLTTAAQNEVDEGWNEMRVMLQHRKKNGSYTRLYLVLGSIAAMLAVMLGYLVNTSNEVKVQSVAKSKIEQPSIKNTPLEKAGNLRITANERLAMVTSNSDVKHVLIPYISDKSVSTTAIVDASVKAVQADNKPANQQQSIVTDASVKAPVIIAQQEINGPVNTNTIQNNLVATPAEENVVKSPVSRTQPKSRFALTFSIAPDMSGVNTVKNNRLGFGAGIALSYALSNKFTVSTGLMYAQKIYSTEYSNYKPSGNNHLYYQPDYVDANCSVLDIPLAVSYTLLNKNNNALSIGTGLSSYFMLKERYNYQYESNYAYLKGLRFTEVKNQNQHYFGVANLEVKYERTITPGLAIGVSPYVKLPLTKIGYGNVNLQSAGVAFSVRTELGNSKRNQ